MKKIDQRLHNLIKSNICQVKNFKEYRDELYSLVKELTDTKKVKKQSNFFKALSDENRLKIIELLKLREMCVCELMIALDMTQPNLSHHLRILEEQDIINHKKKGKWAFYYLNNEQKIKKIIDI
jgi:ArsR family transcriptional regulator